MLIVGAGNGLFQNAYDIDANMVDEISGNIVGSPLSFTMDDWPDFGSLVIDAAMGTFTYTPNVNYTGEDTFTYFLYDDTDTSPSPAYLVRINVTPTPPPAPPPTPGEVSIIDNISQTPLEQFGSVPANVMIMMDDSGSMDFQVVTQGATDNGGFRISNEMKPTATSARPTTTTCTR